MASPNNQQLGDGQDNYAQAAQKAAEAAKEIGKASAAKGAEATANAAAHTVQASVEGGKAVAEVAAGTASAGPVGAILSAAWAMRHTLFKILICACLLLTFFICAIVSLPSIIFNNTFRTDPDSVDPNASTDVYQVFEEMSGAVSDCVSNGYDLALAEVERIIADGEYDYTLSMEALINYGYASVDYDICYVFATYSVSMEQRGTTKSDMVGKLNAVAGQMFAVTATPKSIEVIVPTIVEGEEPTAQTVSYVECTIHPFDQSVILRTFNIDTDASYSQFQINTGTAISNMANALKLTMYGTIGTGSVPPLTDAELIDFLNRLDCSPARKELMRVSLSLVGRVPYFWGGKSAAGWNPEWNTPKLVTSTGSSSSGTIRPYGLDCSGYTDWVYKTALGKSLYEGGTWSQWENSYEISIEDLLPGDLGFMEHVSYSGVNHVLMYAGKSESGEMMWVHCAGSTGVVLNSPDYVKYYRRVSDVDLEGGFFSGMPSGEPLYTLMVDVTHYCACSKCCGQWADGYTASGKYAARGMVAMSSSYPFGTQIMINGSLYTVEDRGGSGIENDISRVDIFVPNHQEALRLGRYRTEAAIYRLGG